MLTSKPNKLESTLTAEELKVEIAQALALPYHDRRVKFAELINSGLTGETEIDAPDWLVNGTNFLSSIWECSFGVGGNVITARIDFNIRLYDGSKLTSSGNDVLLRSFKLFLCLQIHPRYNGGARRAAETESKLFRYATHWLDWVLMNGQLFRLVDCGFSLVTSSDITEYLLLCTNNPVSVHLYNYNTRLENWLREKIGKLRNDVVNKTILDHPEILDLPDASERSLQLSDNELILSRVYLLKKGYMTKGRNGTKYNAQRFIDIEYANTLAGRRMVVPTIDEFSYGLSQKTEYPRVPVRELNLNSVSLRVLSLQLRIVKKIVPLKSIFPTCNINVYIVSTLTGKALASKIVTKPAGRFKTVPADVVFQLMRSSYKFVVDHSEQTFDLVYQALLTAKDWRDGVTYKKVPLSQSIYESVIKKQTVFAMWNIPATTATDQRFQLLRHNVSLFQAYLVLMGSLTLLIGSLTARRQGELLDLPAKGCLYPNTNPNLLENKNVLYRLAFEAEKTGNRRGRQKLKVPIPLMVAKLIWQLQNFHQRCVAGGLVSATSPLFLYIGHESLDITSLDARAHNLCLDAVCDYSESPVIKMAKGVMGRFYIRQHQLRRFFALVFFLSAGFKGLDALRAFLGHSDIQHLHNYITEVIPGSMLDSVKAQCICEDLTNGGNTIQNMEYVKALLCETLGTHDVVVKSHEEIVDDYRELIESGEKEADFDPSDYSSEQLYLSVHEMIENRIFDLQPEFINITTENGEVEHTFRLFVKVKDQ